MPQYNSTDKRTQTIGIEGFTEQDIVLEVIGDTTFAGDVSLGDSDILNFGDGNDLQIYHDGSNSYIDDVGTGNLYLRSGTLLIQNLAGSKTSAVFNSGAGQELYHNDSKKFETTATGATVTCLLYTSPSPRDLSTSRMPSSA